jgi:hypothetical protein
MKQDLIKLDSKNTYTLKSFMNKDIPFLRGSSNWKASHENVPSLISITFFPTDLITGDS